MTELAVFYVFFFLVAMVWPTLRVWRSTGINPVVLPKDDSLEGFVGRWFRVLIAGLGLYLILRAVNIVEPFGSVTLPAAEALRTVGVALLVVSLVWVVIAQWQMGRSWRIGIDSEHPTELVASGLFRFSRNPIFLGMMIQLLGLFLAQPDAITLTTGASAFVLISVQIRQEEAHLQRLHGETFGAYRARVRRWI